MPPYRRSVSPLTLDTCLAPAPEADDDEFLGSDDELDDATRAAKWQRIEKLAESYLQGNQLFILSASLRGPFEQGWRNPWRKNRKYVASVGVSTTSAKSEGSARATKRVVEETDIRDPRNRGELSVPSRDTTGQSTSADTGDVHPPFSSRDARHTSPTALQPGQTKTVKRLARDEQSRAAPWTAKRPKKTSLWGIDNHTIIGDAPVDWLKKDRKLMDFTKAEPPSSPTPRAGHKPIESQSKFMSRNGEEQRSTSRSLSWSPKTFNHAEKEHSGSPMRTSPHSPSPFLSNTEEMSPMTLLPNEPPQSPDSHGRAISSFRVLASTSRLPRFEYRCRNQPDVPSQSWHSHEVANVLHDTVVEDPDSGLPVGIPKDRDAGITGETELTWTDQADLEHGPTAAKGASLKAQHDLAGTGSNSIELDGVQLELDVQSETTKPRVPLSGLGFANAVNASASGSIDIKHPSDLNTHDNLPSAQEVPTLPGVSDRIPSLHSTAVQKPPLGEDDTQLSTQAALVQAQKLFQEDLNDLENELGMTPEQYRAMSGTGNDSLLAHETPLFRPGTTGHAPSLGLKQLDKVRVQAMSTQCMIDAVSPFTFSTEKKFNQFLSISPEKRNLIEGEVESDLLVSHNSQSPDNGDGMAHFEACNSSPRLNVPQSGHATTNPSGTTLPFILSGSTPPTIQDGQGGLVERGSFDLSQAIADAGSWLQQSFV